MWNCSFTNNTTQGKSHVQSSRKQGKTCGGKHRHRVNNRRKALLFHSFITSSWKSEGTLLKLKNNNNNIQILWRLKVWLTGLPKDAAAAFNCLLPLLSLIKWKCPRGSGFTVVSLLWLQHCLLGLFIWHQSQKASVRTGGTLNNLFRLKRKYECMRWATDLNVTQCKREFIKSCYMTFPFYV